MVKKLLTVILLLGFLVMAVRLNPGNAQRESGQLYDEAVLIKIQEQLGELANAAKENKEILRKLEQVLSAQQKILDELEIVKVRASRR